MPWIVFFIAIILINKLPDWIADYRYNRSNNKPNLGKMIEDKYKNNLSNAQVKNNIANGKYNREK